MSDTLRVLRYDDEVGHLLSAYPDGRYVTFTDYEKLAARLVECERERESALSACKELNDGLSDANTYWQSERTAREAAESLAQVRLRSQEAAVERCSYAIERAEQAEARLAKYREAAQAVVRAYWSEGAMATLDAVNALHAVIDVPEEKK